VLIDLLIPQPEGILIIGRHAKENAAVMAGRVKN
jgi:hypothetical protein